MNKALWRSGAGILIAALLAACGNGGEAPEPVATATNFILPTASATSPDPEERPTLTPTISPTPDPSAGLSVPDVPYDISGPEIIAANVGEVTYSGYGCLVTPLGCACEFPELRQSAFSFNSDGSLFFAYSVDDFNDSWDMFRVGVNQWEYAVSILSGENEVVVGQARAILTFTPEGYTLSQVFDFYATGFVTCPDIFYRRMPSSETP